VTRRDRSIEHPQRILSVDLAGALEGVKRVAVLLTQPGGEPELLAAFAVAIRGASGGLLAQAARTITQKPRSDIFNMAISPRRSS